MVINNRDLDKVADTRTLTWNDHRIRFVKISNSWRVVIKDVCDAIGIRTNNAIRGLSKDEMNEIPVDTPYKGWSRRTWMVVVKQLTVIGILEKSRKPLSDELKKWLSNAFYALYIAGNL